MKIYAVKPVSIMAALLMFSSLSEGSEIQKKSKTVEVYYGSAISVYKPTDEGRVTQPELKKEKIKLIPVQSEEGEQPGKYEAERSFTKSVNHELEAHVTYTISWYGGKLVPFVTVNSGLRRIIPDADGYKRYVCNASSSGSITKQKTLEIDLLTNCLIGDDYYVVKTHIRQ